MATRSAQNAVVIHLDTNFLIAFVRSDEPGRSLQARASVEYVNVSAVAWAEFLCGPVAGREAFQARSIIDDIEPMLPLDAESAADLFNRTGRRLRSLRDCMIAAIAIRCDASLATMNLADFRRFEAFGLKLL